MEKEPTKDERAVKEPELDYQTPPPIDWEMYKCQGCGQILLGFARYEHVRDVHKGVDPGFEKMKKD